MIICCKLFHLAQRSGLVLEVIIVAKDENKIYRTVCVDGREERKDGLHPLQLWFNVTDFLVSLFRNWRALVLMGTIFVRKHKLVEVRFFNSIMVSCYQGSA